MKILYIPCHITAEYDEIKLLTELGHEVFSTGIYGDTNSVIENYNNYALKFSRFSHLRPFDIPGYKSNQDLVNKFNSEGNEFTYGERKFSFERDFINSFDLIYVNYYSALCNVLLNSIKNIPIIFNTVSQSTTATENKLKILKANGAHIVRYFETEKLLPDSVEESAIIPQFVEPKEYDNWIGNIPKVLSVSRGLPSRPVHTNANIYWWVSEYLPANLVGPGNEGIPSSLGNVSYDKLKQYYRDYKVFLNLGTKPGGMAYTMIEALMTGCPTVSVGKVLGSSLDLLDGGYTNAVPNFIENGVNGLYSDNILEILEMCNEVLKNDRFATQLSIKARETALTYFSKDVIKEKWKLLLNSIS